ncbi:MAG: SOS response-associated peptidase [Deltaproteobacteria bacterium]|nr:SOS response-associated peptidase [Deltaproteobacteria bacterium]
MCNRITLTLPDAATLLALFGMEDDEAFRADYGPRYNIAPTQEHWLVTPALPLRFLRVPWGLGPQRHLNTRVETLGVRGFHPGEVPCAVPADGFLEWEGEEKDRRPVHFQRADGEPFMLAGVYDGAGFTVLTTSPDAVVGTVHDRMPVLLERSNWRPWLQARVPRAVEALLGSSAPPALVARRVSKRINNAAHDDVACLADAELPAAPRQLRLL